VTGLPQHPPTQFRAFSGEKRAGHYIMTNRVRSLPPNRSAGEEMAVCHEHERELVMLYQRWGTASRSRLAGAGFKPPGAAAFKRRGGERLWKRRPFRTSGVC